MSKTDVEPFLVAIYSPVTKTIKKKFYIIGNDHPKTILSAAREKNTSVLKGYFGNSINRSNEYILETFSHGQQIHGPSKPNKSGGLDDDFFGDIDNILAGPMEETNEPVSGRNGPTAAIIFSPDDEYITDIAVYQFDRIYELAHKITAMTGIPYYRSHIDYISDGNIMSIYKLYAGGLQGTSILDYGKDSAGSNVGTLGVYIDKYLYDIRNDIRVWVTDAFSIVGNSKMAIVADLNEIFAPSLASTLIEDKYQLELIYYGLVVKYFPQMTIDVFRDYISDERQLGRKYPGLARDVTYLKSQYRIEQTLLSQKRDVATKDTLMGVTRATVTGDPRMASEINIRAIFDYLHTSERVPEMRYYTTVGNVPTEFRKIHTSAGKYEIPSIAILRLGVTFLINIMAGTVSRVAFLSISPAGRWYLKCAWDEEDFINFDNIMSATKEFIGTIFDEINDLGLKAFPTGIGSLTIDNMRYEHITASMYWKKILSENQFREFTSIVDKFISADILRPYELVNSTKDSKMYIFRKGMYKFDESLIDRILTMTGHGELGNHFVYLTSGHVRTKWDEAYSGRPMKIIHRSADIRLEVADISAEEFELFGHVMSIILGTARKLLSNAPVMNRDTLKKKLKKNQEEDPLLYNLKKQGYPVVYSRICQKKMQPVVYQAEEYPDLPDALKKKLVKFHNFTYNKDAWYSCPGNEYKHLNFIAGVHPLGFCMPCCFKTAVNEREAKSKKIFDTCIAKFHGPEDIVSESKHILTYGKVLDPGRVGHVPDALKKLVPSDSVLLGVQQYFKSVYVPMFAIGAMCAQTSRGETFEASLYSKLLKAGDAIRSILPADINPKDVVAEFHRTFTGSGLENDRLPWNDIIIGALDLFWGISVVFISGDNMTLPKNAEKIVFIVQRDDSKEGPQWNPIVILANEYTRTGKTGTAVFHVNELDIFMESFDALNQAENNLPNKDIVAEILPGLTRKYIGRYNRCYAADITYKGAQLVIPVKYSEYKSGQGKITFEPPTYVNDPALLYDFITHFEVPGYKQIVPGTVIKRRDSYIGFIDSNSGLQYLHKGLVESPFFKDTWSIEDAHRTMEIDYDPMEVSKAIMRGTGRDIIDNDRMLIVNHALYDYYLYDLVAMQFFGYVLKNKNVVFHDLLAKTFNDISIRSNFAALMTLTGLDRKTTDFKRIISIIDSYKFGHKSREKMLASLRDTRFDADGEFLTNLIKLNRDDKVKSIKNILSGLVERRNNLSISDFPNVYGSCIAGSTIDYCNGNLLLVSTDDAFYNSLPSLIAADLDNVIKMSYYLDRMYYDNVIDQFRFIPADNEKLFVRRMTSRK